MTSEDLLNGQVFLIDKPLHWTSFQVVNKLRWAIKKKYNLKKIKVGHAGTLDPLATGLLIICTGKFTKRINEFQEQQKEYTGTFFIGATTPSFDLETEVEENYSINHITNELIYATTEKFKGEIEQFPPLYSAIKKDGKRLYELARAGESATIPSRKITIFDFDITNINLPYISFRVECSKGTYIRSLANDFGKALNTGAYLFSLRRTKIGNFYIENAKSIDEFLSDLNKA